MHGDLDTSVLQFRVAIKPSTIPVSASTSLRRSFSSCRISPSSLRHGCKLHGENGALLAGRAG
jgi:hypothetical protein